MAGTILCARDTVIKKNSNSQALCVDGVSSLETRVKSDWTKKVNNEEENSELK